MMINDADIKKKSKQKKKIIIFLTVLLIFFSGIWTERFDVDKKISIKFKNLIDATSQTIYSSGSKKKIYLNIKQKNYNEIIESRKISLEKGRATEDIQVWVPAKLVYDNNSYDIQLSLKGTHADHWSHESKWSFKIKVKENEKSIFGLRRFAVQAPYTISYIYEWLFMTALAKENLINLNVDFMNVIVNENNLGVYVLEEKISPKLLEKVDRDPGPIIGFSKTLWVQEAINSKKLGVNGIDESFWRAKIEPTQFDKNLIGTNQEKSLKNAIYLLESFRNKSLKASEVFDVNQLAKVMAIRAIIGSSQFDWKDIKFYYNPKTSLLEPISKEIHVDLNYEDRVNFWWADSSYIKEHLASDTDFFLDILYSDINFYRIYLSELNKFSKNKYFEDLINENKQQFDKNEKILKRNYPTKMIFSKKNLETKRKFIQSTLDPIQGLNAYFLDYHQNNLKIVVKNVQRLPIEITGLELNDGTVIKLEKKVIIEGKKPQRSTVDKIINVNCNSKKECSKKLINKQKILFNILGQEKNKLAKISEHYLNNEK